MKITAYEECQFNPGQALFKEQSRGKYVYLIKMGEVITVREEKGRLIPTGLHEEKDFVGLISCLTGQSYVESAVARKLTIAIPIPIYDIKHTIKSCPPWIEKLLKIMGERLESSVDLISEHKILEDLQGYGETYTPQDEAQYRKSLEGFTSA